MMGMGGGNMGMGQPMGGGGGMPPWMRPNGPKGGGPSPYMNMGGVPQQGSGFGGVQPNAFQQMFRGMNMGGPQQRPMGQPMGFGGMRPNAPMGPPQGGMTPNVGVGQRQSYGQGGMNPQMMASLMGGGMRR